MSFKYGCYTLRRALSLFIFAQVVMGMVIVDDSDPLIVFSNVGPSWIGQDSYHGPGDYVGYISLYDRSKGPYQWTWHEVLGDGAWASMTFTGTRVNLTGTIRRSHYQTTVDFYIDGQYMTRFQHIPATEPYVAGDIDLQFTMANFDNLSPAEHTLKAVSVGADSLFVVDYIAYEPSAIVPISSGSVSAGSASISSGALSTMGSTSIGSASSTSSTVLTSLSTFSSPQPSHSTSSIAVGNSQPLVAAMDTPASDPRVVYSPPEAWSPYSDTRRANSCLEGIRSSSTAGSYLTYNFMGAAIQVYTVSSSIGGNYSISIDGENQGIFTSYAASEDPLGCSSKPLYSTTGLNDTQHTLVLTAQDHPAGSTQNTIQFVGFRTPSSPAGVPSSSGSTASGPNVGVIVGGVIGILAGFALVILLIMWWMRRQRQAEEALLAEALGASASPLINRNPVTSASRSERHTQEQSGSAAESVSPPGPPRMVQHGLSAIGAANSRNSIHENSSERLTHYTLPSYHENVMQRPAARNLSQADVEAISRRLRQVMRNQAALSGGTPSELMPPRELIDHLVQEHLEPPVV